MSYSIAVPDSDTYVLPDAPECPGCGLEAEVETYWREAKTHKRVGYTCSCKAVVLYGVVQLFV